MGLSLNDFDDERIKKVAVDEHFEKLNKIDDNTKPTEHDRIRKYRFLDKYSPDGAKVVDMVLDREYKITEQIQALKASHPAIIEFHDKTDNTEWLLEYFRSVPAGTGTSSLSHRIWN